MFLDHFHIIASLANQTFFFKANLSLYLPQVLLAWRPNPAGQFQHNQISDFFFAKLEMMWEWSRNIKLLIIFLRKVFKSEPLKDNLTSKSHAATTKYRKNVHAAATSRVKASIIGFDLGSFLKIAHETK